MIRSANPTQGYVTFSIAGQRFGVPVATVQEVVPHQDLARVPLAPPEIAGLLNLRGVVVTALDLRPRLGLSPRTPGAPALHVVVRDGGELLSLLVDEIGEVVEVEELGIEPAPATLGELWSECCAGIVRLPHGLLLLLSLEPLLGDRPIPAPG